MTKLVFASFGGMRTNTAQKNLFYRSCASIPVTNILATRADKNELEQCLSYASLKPKQITLWLDSGAYSVWTKGIEFKAIDYYDWIMSYFDRLSIFKQVFVISLDKIPGEYGRKPSKDDIKKAIETSIANTEYLQSRGLNVVPVHHQGESIEVMEHYLSICNYVGISPANDSKQKDRINYIKSLANLFKSRSTNNCYIPTHNFGNISIEQLKIFPFYSADSTSWKLSTGFGTSSRKQLVKTASFSNDKIISYQAKHQAQFAYLNAVKAQMNLESELKRLWEYRNVSFIEPIGLLK